MVIYYKNGKKKLLIFASLEKFAKAIREVMMLMIFGGML